MANVFKRFHMLLLSNYMFVCNVSQHYQQFIYLQQLEIFFRLTAPHAHPFQKNIYSSRNMSHVDKCIQENSKNVNPNFTLYLAVHDDILH